MGPAQYIANIEDAKQNVNDVATLLLCFPPYLIAFTRLYSHIDTTEPPSVVSSRVLRSRGFS